MGASDESQPIGPFKISAIADMLQMKYIINAIYCVGLHGTSRNLISAFFLVVAQITATTRFGSQEILSRAGRCWVRPRLRVMV